MKRQHSGFTLIELIIVIVILGALAAVALPRFVDLQQDAQEAAVNGVAGNISSAFAINYADSLVGDTTGVIAVTSGDDITINGNGELLVGGALGLLTTADLDDYSIAGCSVTSTSSGDSGSCDIDLDNESASFTWIATE